MNTYGYFAKVYDLFMEDAPYDDWVLNLEKLWSKYNKKPVTIVDVGCGTGIITTLLHNKGYDIIGVDMSDEMLAQANNRALENNASILYLNQDMRNLKLFNNVDCIISLCDTINYILKFDELNLVFNLVSKYLNPEGVFIFDINTEYKYKNILCNNNFGSAYEDAAYIWENFYDEKTKINEYYTSFFIKSSKGYYERYEEIHYQRAYSVLEIEAAIKNSKLKLLDVLDTDTFKKPNDKSERLYFIAERAKI